MARLGHKSAPGICRSVLVAILAAAAVLLTTACERVSPQQSALKQERTQMQTISVPVEGMSCGACAARLKKTLKAIDGVRDVHVNLEQRNAQIEYERGKVVPERLTAAINELGYKAGAPTPSKNQ